ncbi:HAAS signaling domain-containing protein [Staphylococcus felis]
MKKQEYLQTLYLHLKNIPEEEKQDIVAEYDRHFIEGLKDGRSEEEIAEILGSPKGIARDLSASSAIHTAENEKNSFNIA